MFRISITIHNQANVGPTETIQACDELVPDWLGNRSAPCQTSVVMGWIGERDVDVIVDVFAPARGVSQRGLKDQVIQLQDMLERRLKCGVRVCVALSEQFAAPTANPNPSATPRSADYTQY